MRDLKALLGVIAGGGSLTRDEAEGAFHHLLSGEATPAQMGAFLMGLRLRGETIEEITGAVAAMRAQMVRVKAPAGAIDIVGTGGDGHGTYNVSTLAAFIAAACGVPVAKHGNRAASSRSGSSDVLAALGVDVGLGAEGVERCLAAANIGFMSAPNFHPAMRRISPIRAELGTRTLFNLLGPLSNPAGVKRLLVGVFAESWVEPLAQALANLGAERVLVVHGADGLDEITTTGPTIAVSWDGTRFEHLTIAPDALGVPLASLGDLKGGDAAHNAAAMRSVLAGARNPYRDIACLNAAGALVVAGAAGDFREGLDLAGKALDSGRAAEVLDRLTRATQTAALEG